MRAEAAEVAVNTDNPDRFIYSKRLRKQLGCRKPDASSEAFPIGVFNGLQRPLLFEKQKQVNTKARGQSLCDQSVSESGRG